MTISPFQAYVTQRLNPGWTPPVAFGEGSPGFDPEKECFVLREGQYRLSGNYMNSPWCVQKLMEAVDTAFQRSNEDVAEALRKNPALKDNDRVVRWRKIFDDWKAERNVMGAQLQTAKDNSETWEGEPDDADENSSNQRQRLEMLLDKTAEIREQLKTIGVELRQTAETKEEKEARVGVEPETPAQTTARITRNVAIAAVAVAGVYALSQLSFFLPKRSK
jgi:2,4-dienoyl-CoA reductase-like NADH-dependent reductase (Old Yellow Enzyme family)